MDNEFDVAIVGASLAGASAAITLAKLGLKVALIDKSSFPRRKPCGEGLSHYGLKQLSILGVKDDVLKLPHLRYEGYKLRSGKSNALLSCPWGGGITIQRLILDNALLASALKYTNVEPFLSTNVIDIKSGLLKTDCGEIRARSIVLACGGNSNLLAKVPISSQRYGISRCGISATFAGSFKREMRHVHIIIYKNYEVYCTPLAEGRLNINILSKTDSNENLRKQLLSAEILRDVFQETEFSGEIELVPQGRTGIGSIRRSSLLPGIMLAGDALEEFDPIGGMGMSHALRSGRHVADMIINDLRPGVYEVSKDKQTVSMGKNAAAMRAFTALSYKTMRSAAHYPFVLSLAGTSLAAGAVKLFSRGLV